MLLIAGIIPSADFPLVKGTIRKENSIVKINDYSIPAAQGTAAMLSSALAVTTFLNLDPPQVLLAGDTGSGKGSRAIYKYLIENIADLQPRVLALHYCMPILQLTKKLVTAVKRCSNKPVLIADAASMYAAKAAGVAPEFDIFTPDASELAFLADPEAVHPAYMSRYLFEADISTAPELINKAYKYQNSAQFLLVKGAIDYLACDGSILGTITQPDVPEIECIGGTGDTITGMIAALIYAGLDPQKAAVISAAANRLAGQRAKANPATKINEIIDQFPAVFADNLNSWILLKGDY